MMLARSSGQPPSRSALAISSLPTGMNWRAWQRDLIVGRVGEGLAGGFDLLNIRETAARNRQAGGALSAGVIPPTLAIDGLGQGDGQAPFAHAFRTGKKARG